MTHPQQATLGTVAPEKAVAALSDQPKSDTLFAHILSALDENKAEEVVSINLIGRSEMADYMIICSGRSSRQVVAIADKLTDSIKAEFRVSAKVEGRETGDWVLIDTGDVIVHVFRPEVREFYQLEKMWLASGQATAKA